MKLALLLAVATLAAVAPDLASSAHHQSPAPAPAPSVDCSSLILNMADCLSYVSNGSTTVVPEKTCCSGLKTVLSADPGCLCEGLKSSAQLGVVLNVTKAVTLPAACKLPSPSLASCGLSLLAPAAAPGTLTGVGDLAPAQSPGNSGSFLLKASFSNLLFTIFLVALL